MSDKSFIDMLKQNCCLSGPHFPPPAIEVLQDYVTNFHKVRRLHLIVMDLWRLWKYNTARAREITDQLWFVRNCENTRRVSPFWPDGPGGNIRPRWRLLQQHLKTKGPGWYPLAEREERLFANRFNRPGDDMKDELRTDNDPFCVEHLEYFTEPAMAANFFYSKEKK